MLPSLVRFSRTTYRGARGSGPGKSSKADARSSPKSRNTLKAAIASGQVFKRSQTGLYHLAQLQSGHNVPKSRQKTARTWEPNVQRKRLESAILGQTIKMKVTTKALRCIKKAGGLDNYIRTTKDDALGVFGRKLRIEMGAVAGLRLQMEGLGLVKTLQEERLERESTTQKKAAPGRSTKIEGTTQSRRKEGRPASEEIPTQASPIAQPEVSALP